VVKVMKAQGAGARHSSPSSFVILRESGESRNTGSQEKAKDKAIFAKD
jgi:hypothetical protein